jgi:Rieske Fe-S protein
MSRRAVLAAGAAAVSVTTLAACGGGGTAAAPEPGGGASSTSGGGPAGGGSGGGAPAGLAKVADIPVGGAVSAETSDGQPVIVSQPSAGQIVAFSAICTHQGCTVAPAGSMIRCPCHGSTYDLATGANTGGPAPKPLAAVPVKVKRGEVVQA